jgi:hypothetical protein
MLPIADEALASLSASLDDLHAARLIKAIATKTERMNCFVFTIVIIPLRLYSAA